MSDELEGPGVRDVQTVTRKGMSTLTTIDGVVTMRPPTHLDERGMVFEIFSENVFLSDEPVVHVYQTSVLPGHIKGWARHEVKIDRYSLAVGTLIVLLFDGRKGSPTEGVLQRVVLSPTDTRQVRIPVGVWHMLINAGTEEVHVINLPTEPYHHGAPDRILLPWDTDEIPVDVRKYLPKF